MWILIVRCAFSLFKGYVSQRQNLMLVLKIKPICKRSAGVKPVGGMVCPETLVVVTYLNHG
jgi:hypothetical protein